MMLVAPRTPNHRRCGARPSGHRRRVSRYIGVHRVDGGLADHRGHCASNDGARGRVGIEWAIATSCVLYGIVVALAYVGPMRVRTKASERVGAS